MKYLLMSLSMLLACGVSIGMAAPQLNVEKLNYDFGEVIQGGKVEYSFRFTNTGDEVLEIGNVRSSCGCTAALLSAKRIAPGDMGELKATFDSTRFRGAVSKVISMETNDPNLPLVSFNMYGDVKVELMLSPDRINWGTVKKTDPLNSQVTISNRGDQTITLQEPQSTNPAVSATLSALQLGPGQEVQLDIAANFPAEKSRLGGYVIIATDYPNVPQLRVSVSARLAK